MLAERTRAGRFRNGPGTFPLHDVRYPQPPALGVDGAKLFDPDDPSTLPRSAGEGGGAGRDRTDDLMLAKHALSQLSYSPEGAARWQNIVT